ncbi:hypothetical protein [Agriterribacter sp.]|uniref:hypothetical protein n=1 Tax=Agriterribacter sp. TaxID=2821509 RepID=UPI002B67F27F|nr:hypothetical protein [Agriterribacter sp.]HRP57172.1 hypothetical protein [Agriterribacter sp.]
MAGAVKFTLEYNVFFWRKEGYSGMLYSHAGIVTEMYDHTSFEEDKYGFTGFLNSGAVSYSRDTRRELVLPQLGELLGEKIMHPASYFDKVWNDEFIADGSPAFSRPISITAILLFSRLTWMEGCIFAAQKRRRHSRSIWKALLLLQGLQPAGFSAVEISFTFCCLSLPPCICHYRSPEILQKRAKQKS